MPPRSIWKGAITFGLVNVPVAMVTATRNHDIRMNLVHAADGVRLKQQRICPADGTIVEWDDVDRGVERADGTFVRITDDELSGLAAEKSRAMEIEDVVPLEQIDPMYVEKSWYLVPAEGGARGYALLASALSGTGRAAIARLTMRGRQQLVSIRSTGTALVVESLRYADEVVAVEKVLDEDDLVEAKDKEVKMARAFLESLEVDFDPSRYVDEYQEQLAQLIERKAKEGDFAVQPEAAEAAPSSTPVDDIMAALEASLARQRAGSGSGSSNGGSRGASSATGKAKAAGSRRGTGKPASARRPAKR
jgi:DNA end-binding protein Ku